MLRPTTITILLTNFPTANSPPLEVVMEVAGKDQAARVPPFDDDKSLSPEIVVWLDVDGRPRLDIVFPDGLYLSAAHVCVLEARNHTAGWGVLGGAAVCVAALLTCPFDMAAAVCRCLGLVVDEWEAVPSTVEADSAPGLDGESEDRAALN
jgi:hypothetical protein